MTTQATLALPSLYEVRAPVEWRAVDFISDLHLGAGEPATFDAWQRFMATTDADAIFILGDLFEVWVGDDASEQPRTFESRCAEVLAEAAGRVRVALMPGNRDFLIGSQLLRTCGVMALPDPSVLDAWGHRVLLTHGDALCLVDTGYQAFRRQVRSDAWRRDFLAKPLPERRRLAQEMRDASETLKRNRGPADWADVDFAAAVSWLHAAGSHDLVHGHTHRPGSEALAPGFTRHVLSDWDGAARPPRAEVLRLTRDGFARRAP